MKNFLVLVAPVICSFVVLFPLVWAVDFLYKRGKAGVPMGQEELLILVLLYAYFLSMMSFFLYRMKRDLDGEALDAEHQKLVMSIRAALESCRGERFRLAGDLTTLKINYEETSRRIGLLSGLLRKHEGIGRRWSG